VAIRLPGTPVTELDKDILKDEEEHFVFQCGQARKSGRYPINVAAKLIAQKAGFGVSADKIEDRLKSAALDRSLPVYEIGQNVRWDGDMPFFSLLDIYLPDLNQWLAVEEPKIGKFPESESQSNANSSRIVGEVVKASSVSHQLTKRTNILNPVIELAKKNSLQPHDTASIFSALVQLANMKDKPAPLLGFVDEEGVKYQGPNKVEFFTLKNLRDRMSRAKKRVNA
jgi:hypothetical protein